MLSLLHVFMSQTADTARVSKVTAEEVPSLLPRHALRVLGAQHFLLLYFPLVNYHIESAICLFAYCL